MLGGLYGFVSAFLLWYVVIASLCSAAVLGLGLFRAYARRGRRTARRPKLHMWSGLDRGAGGVPS